MPKEQHLDVTFEYRDPNRLTDHPINVQVYGSGEEGLEKLVGSVTKGILQPLLITPAGEVVAGHRRKLAAIRAGLSKVPCNVLSKKYSPAEIERMVLDANIVRVKTPEMVVREAQQRMRIEAELTKKDLAPGPTRKRVAETMGVSEKTVERGEKIANALDAAEAAGDTQKADAIRDTLNTEGFKPAADVAADLAPGPSCKEKPASDLRDDRGNLVPEHLRSAFIASHEIDAVNRDLCKAQSRLHAVLKTVSFEKIIPVGKFDSDLALARACLRDNRPSALCKTCGGTGSHDDAPCCDCGSDGWVTAQHAREQNS